MRRTPELVLYLMSSKVEKPHCRWVILFNDKSGMIYFTGDSKVYLLQKCKSLAGDFKFHVKCFEIAVEILLWVWVKKNPTN